MECQDEMVEMESQEAKGRGETLVCRGHLAREVCMHFDTYIPILNIKSIHHEQNVYRSASTWWVIPGVDLPKKRGKDGGEGMI